MKMIPSSRTSIIRSVILILILITGLLWGWGFSVKGKLTYQPVEGDLLFQSLPNGVGLTLVDAIEGSTESPFSHCGVVVNRGGEWFILEAMVPTVQETPMKQWLRRDRDRFAAYRLKKESDREKIPRWIAGMRERLGIAYDYRYQMNDERIYCSELPFDAWFDLTGEQMGKVVTLGDLKWEPYRKVIAEVEGSDVVPVEREMITPRDLAKASQLELIVENGVSVDDRP